MEPLSVATSVAGVAGMGVQVSQAMYGLIPIFCEAEKEMSGIANDLSLLAMVLKELEGILRGNSRVYRRRMVRVANDISKQCEDIFQSILIYVSINPQDTRSPKQFQGGIRWCFQRRRVRQVQAGISSMRSALEVLLHVVHLARVTEAEQTVIPKAGSTLTDTQVQKEREILVGVVLENRRDILGLTKIEADHDRRQDLRNVNQENRELERTTNDTALCDCAPNIERNFGPPELIDSRGFGPFHGWEGGSSANISTVTGLFSKAAKDSATDTTYSNTLPFGEKKRSEKTATTSVGSSHPHHERSEADKAEGFRARGDHSWQAFNVTAGKKEHDGKTNDPFHHILTITNSAVIDTVPRNTPKAADDVQTARYVASCKKKGQEKKEVRKQTRKKAVKNNRKSRDVLLDLNVPAESGSQSEDAAKVYEVLEAGSHDSKRVIPNSSPVSCQTGGAGNLPSSSISQENSPSRSSTSEYYSMPPDIPIVDSTESHYPEDDLAMKSGRQVTASANGLAVKISKSQPSLPSKEMVSPTAQWFLSVIPHELSVSTLIERSRSGEANHLKVRAEETAKALFVDWTNVDPALVFGEDNSAGSNSTAYTTCFYDGPSRDEEVPNKPYQMFCSPQLYPTYAPQQWYVPPIIAGSSHGNKKQTDNEELARLKKLILDEKAEQDAKTALMAAAVAPPIPNGPVLTEKVLENTVQRADLDREAVDSTHRPQEHEAILNVKPPRRQPVIMRDWLGRKFIFPVDMCQTWEGLHSLIREAFGHVHEYKPIVEKGCYSISHITGEVILPSTWNLFVHPGLEINMGIRNVVKVARNEASGKAAVDGGEAIIAGTESLTPPRTPEAVRLGSPIALRFRSEYDPAIDEAADNETVYSSPGGVSYVERSDHRYSTIENVLLEQKKARVETEMKLERNRRFFQLKQQLLDQGAAILARQDAAEHAERETKLAWLEKQVRDQKEELDRLPPLSMTTPSSSVGGSLGESTTSPQRKASFLARLLSRIPSRSNRSKDSFNE